MAANEKSRERLGKLVEEEVTHMFEQILDYAQVACPTPDTYKVLRSKILRVGNNCIRSLKTQLKHYDIEYKAVAEDVIQFEQKEQHSCK
jgi:hypothetical protein